MVRVGHELHVCKAAYGVIRYLMAVIPPPDAGAVKAGARMVEFRG
jgi:hypothetical protein